MSNEHDAAVRDPLDDCVGGVPRRVVHQDNLTDSLCTSADSTARATNASALKAG